MDDLIYGLESNRKSTGGVEKPSGTCVRFDIGLHDSKGRHIGLGRQTKDKNCNKTTSFGSN